MTETAPERAATPENKYLALEFLLVFLVFFVPLQACVDAAKFTVFTTRDLDRAHLLAAGRLIFFGPEASGGGHLPGSFYYFLMAAPLKLGLGWKAVWELQLALAAAGYSLLWLFIRRKLGAFPAYYALFCSAFFDTKVLFFAYNASFLPLLTAAALTSLCSAFEENSTRRGLYWAAFCLCCGLGLQFHMTFTLLLAGGLLVQLAARRLGLTPLPGRAFAGGLALFLATLLPYGAWLAAARLGHSLGQPALPITGANAVKLMEILDYSFQARAGMPAHILINRTLSLLPFEALIPLLLLYSGFAAEKGRPDQARETAPERAFAGVCVKVLAVAAALTFFTYAMSLALSPSRYAIIPRLSLDLLVCALLAGRQHLFRPERFYPAAAGALAVLSLAWHLSLSVSGGIPFSFTGLLLAALAGLGLALLVRRGGGGRALTTMALVLPLFLSYSLSANIASHAQDDMPGAADFKKMSRVILAQTGWTYDEARLRIFYLNLRAEVTPSYIYRAAEAEGLPPGPASSGLDRVDGYFAALLKNRSRDWNAWTIKQRVLSQDLPGMLREGLASGRIRLGAPAECGRLSVIPYEVTDTQSLPPYFHNSSEGYTLTGPEPAPEPAPGARDFRFTFNDCPGHGEWCDIVADARLRRGSGGRWLARVTFSGEPLAQVCDGVNMQWNQLLKRPYFAAVCAGKARRVQLAETIGMSRDRDRNMNQSLLAPYVRDFYLDCPGQLKQVSVGYESADAYSLAKKIEGLPGREQSAGMEANAPSR